MKKKIYLLLIFLAAFSFGQTQCALGQVCLGPGEELTLLPGDDAGDNAKVGPGLAFNEASLFVEGGTVGDNMMIMGSGNVFMSDGEIGGGGSMEGAAAFVVGGAFFRMDGGLLGPSFLVDDNSTMEVCGGFIEPGLTIDASSCTLVPGAANLNISGAENELSISHFVALSGMVNIMGTQFSIGGTPQNLMPCESRSVDQRGAGLFLNGCYSDGTPFSFELNNNPGGADLFLDPPINEFGPGVCLSITDTVEPAESHNAFRGFLVEGSTADVVKSDDERLIYQPGFVLNDTEAPVWLIFDGHVGNVPLGNKFDDPEIVTFVVESQAGTPGLELTVEMFNWITNQWDVIGVDDESFNSDKFRHFNLSELRHLYVKEGVRSEDGRVRARLGWRQTGFIINFPWNVRVDQVGWMSGCPALNDN